MIVTLIRTTYVVALQVHTVMATVFPKGRSLLQQDNTPENIVQKWFVEHDVADVTLTHTTYVVALLHGTVLPNGSGMFQQDKAPCHTAEIAQKWFVEHSKEFKVLTWPENFPGINPMEHR